MRYVFLLGFVGVLLAGFGQKGSKAAAAPASEATAQPQTTPPAVLVPHQAALLVRNADTTQAWYTHCFGFAPVDSITIPESGLRIRILERGGFRLELLENETTVHPDSALNLVPQYNGFYGYYKLTFRTPDLEGLDAHLRALNVRYFFSLRKEETGGNEFLIVYDPDGNLVQIVGE